MDTFPVNLKRLSDVVNKFVVGKSEYSKLKSKVMRVELKFPSRSTLIHNSQYNTGKQCSGKK